VQASSLRGRKEAAVKHALSLLPGSGIFLEAAASTRSYRVQAHKQTCVFPHVEEVHARKWKPYAPMQDTALYSFYLIQDIEHFFGPKITVLENIST
jgi:hypothetical protein